MRAALIEPMRSIYGVSDQSSGDGAVIAADARKQRNIGSKSRQLRGHRHVSAQFLAPDGILRLRRDHPYGMGCYRPGGCADLLQVIGQEIDGIRGQSEYPRVFPRFRPSANLAVLCRQRPPTFATAIASMTGSGARMCMSPVLSV